MGNEEPNHCDSGRAEKSVDEPTLQSFPYHNSQLVLTIPAEEPTS